MGRTLPSFRIATDLEYDQWKSFYQYLEKEDKKLFDEMFSLTNLYNSTCSIHNDPIIIKPIMISILFHHYKQLLSLQRELREDEVNIKPFPLENSISELDEFISESISDALQNNEKPKIKVKTLLDYL